MHDTLVRPIVALVLAAPGVYLIWIGVNLAREGGYATLIGPPMALGGTLMFAGAVRFGLHKPDPDAIDWAAWGWLLLIGFVLLNKLFYLAH